jgi:Tol biopolymer transport system component
MTPVDRIAHYEIGAKLGQGGMGAVYRAHDTKLNREVAIKVLPDALANDPDYLSRFTREAQGFGVEERIGGGPIPLEEALDIARQIAEALEAAHEKGVIHRDLKPANVKVTPEGVVKVLDFGLAKAPDAIASAAGATMSPTLTIRATQVGVIMGTAGYMAPEQAAGKPVDRRADIWSFGVVLYEMLSGKMLFTGETVSHTLASVLKDPIDVESVNAPASIQQLLRRCLNRDPKERLRDIGEARIAIREYAANPPAEAKAAGRGSWIPWTAAAVALLAAAGAWFRPKPAELRLGPARFSITFPAGTSVTRLEKDEAWHSWPQFLPDGRHLLYYAVGKTPQEGAIYVQELGSSKRVLVAHNETRGAWVSPGFLLFARESTLFAQRMNSGSFQLEGEPLTVAEEVTVNRTNGRSDFAVSETGVLAYLTAVNSPVRQLTWYGRDGVSLGPAGKPGDYTNLSLSPDAKRVALQSGNMGKHSTSVMDLVTGVVSPMTRDGKELFSSPPVWSPDGRRLALGLAGGGTRVLTLESGALAVVSDKYNPQDWSPDGHSILGIDLSGTHVVLIPPEENGKTQTILESTYLSTNFRFSPDGKYVAYASFESATGEVYVASFPSFAVKRKISTSGGGNPVWTKGGKEMLFSSAEQSLMSVEVHLGSTIEASIPPPLFRVAHRPGFFSHFGATPDGSRILLRELVGDASEKPQIAVVLNWAAEMR